MLKHGTVIPLIGGMTIGAEKAFGAPPTYLASYSAFAANDSHARNWYADVPFFSLDEKNTIKGKVDAISTVCPCAGLSQMHNSFGSHNEINDWMIKTATLVLSELKPRVFWGENAPGLIGSIGEGIRNKLLKIASDNGYVVSFYKTKSQLHGTPQVRQRTFYFFWKGDRIPILNWYDEPYQKIEDLIRSVRSNFQSEPINTSTPSHDPYYRYILEVIHGGITHRQFSEMMKPLDVRSNDVQSYIESKGVTYETLGAWMKEQGLNKETERCVRVHAKLSTGGNIMRRQTIIPKDIIGAFVGHYPMKLAHPDEDRYITYREAMAIMGLPNNFELLEPKKSYNHICQNVPVKTATDIAKEVVAVLNDEREYVNNQKVLYQYNDRLAIEYSKEKQSSVLEFM